MKIRVKFFLIFLTIAIFTFLVSYYIAGISIRKILSRQTEQTLNSSLYTNYSITKNLIDKFNSELLREITIRNLPDKTENSSDNETVQTVDEIFTVLELDYLQVKKSDTILYSKSNYSDMVNLLPNNFTEPEKFYTIMTGKGLLLLGIINLQREKNIIITGGKLINENFFEKLYQEDVNIAFYWNGTPFLSTNKLFREPLPLSLHSYRDSDEFFPSETFLIRWEDRSYKIKFQTVFNNSGNRLQIATMSSTLFEDKIFLETISNLVIFLGIFIIVLIILSYFISRSFIEPFYELAVGISKKDKTSIKKLLTRKDEIGNLANEFWNITDDLLKQQEHKEKVNSLITHDLKTPLVAITRTLETIRDKDNLGKEQRILFVNLMIKHCKQSLELINNLLKVQKYELGKMNLFMAEEFLNQLLEECVTGLKPIADEKEIIIETLYDSKNPKMMFDRTELMRVVNNLLGNALKYTPEHGHIKILSRFSREKAEVRISDDGKGISFFEQKKIFNFYKSSYESETKEESQDIPTGLGLYLCKQIIEAHGGKIGFESYKNKGSTFYFIIPLR